MERRQYVAALGAIVATGLAGCGDENDGSNGTETPTETQTGTPGSEDPEDWQETYRSALEEQGIQVDFVDVNEQRLVLDYVTETTEVGEFLREVETVATTYAEVVAETWDREGVELWALDPDVENPQERALASFFIENELAFARQNNEQSTNEYMENVLDTAERYQTYYDRYGEATPTPTDGGNSTSAPTDGGNGNSTSTE